MQSKSVWDYFADSPIQDTVRVCLDCRSLARLAATCRVGLDACSRNGELRCRDLSLTSKTCAVALAAVYTQDIRTLCVQYDGTQGALQAARAALDIPFLADFELLSHNNRYNVDTNEQFAPHIALANLLSEVVMKPSLRIFMVQWPDHAGWDGGRWVSVLVLYWQSYIGSTWCTDSVRHLRCQTNLCCVRRVAHNYTGLREQESCRVKRLCNSVTNRVKWDSSLSIETKIKFFYIAGNPGRPL